MPKVAVGSGKVKDRYHTLVAEPEVKKSKKGDFGYNKIIENSDLQNYIQTKFNVSLPYNSNKNHNFKANNERSGKRKRELMTKLY